LSAFLFRYIISFGHCCDRGKHAQAMLRNTEHSCISYWPIPCLIVPTSSTNSTSTNGLRISWICIACHPEGAPSTLSTVFNPSVSLYLRLRNNDLEKQE
jgi:hypothetical protein